MRYRKRPMVIEAMQFTEESKEIVYHWASSLQMNIQPAFRNGIPVLLIPTLQGEMVCELDDWVIQEPFPTDWRKVYPCKPNIFEKTYEPVKEAHS